MVSRTRLLLADDHAATAAQLRELLQPEFDVIGHVTDGLALVRDAARLSPDVIVSDISMPELDGITAAARILERDPTARIIFVSIHADPLLVARSLATGAFSYIHKLAAGDDLVPAVHAALRGERQVSSGVQLEELRRSRR